MVNRVVSNTGPIIHLTEINLINALNIFQKIFIPPEVKSELKYYKINISTNKKILVTNLKPGFKDIAEMFTSKFSLDLGEAQAVALALQERTDYFLTDDLDARSVSNLHGIEAHGSIGIILRAFRENIIDKDVTIEKVKKLYTSSTLFITKDLVDNIINSVNEFGK